MNFRIDQAVADYRGASGMRVIRQVATGKATTEDLLRLLDPQVLEHKPKARLREALTGQFDPGNVYILKRHLEMYDSHESLLARIRRDLLSRMKRLECRTDLPQLPPPPKNYSEARLGFDEPLRPLFYRIYGIDMATVPGIGPAVMLAMLCRLGTSLASWPGAEAFSAWLGLAPNNKISARRCRSGRTRPVRSWLASALKAASMSLPRTDGLLAEQYRSMVRRKPPGKVKTAMARKLSVILYRHITTGVQPEKYSVGHGLEERLGRRRRRLEKECAKLGCLMIPRAAGTAEG